MATSLKDFEKQWAKLVQDIKAQATPFPADTPALKTARVERARVDRFFFAAAYFPHYIQLAPGFEQVYRDPRKDIDWITAGFSPVHGKFFQLAELNNKFVLLAAFRESAKDTLLGKIDLIHKIVFERIWFAPIVAMTVDLAGSKVAPLKFEFEANERLLSDFGDLTGKIEWGNDSFITANGRKVAAYGREQSLRGQENFGHRPDWIMLNDIEDPVQDTNPALVQKYVDNIKSNILKGANSPRWGALCLCNYVSKEGIVNELFTGEHTQHYDKNIFPVLLPNPRKTVEEKEIAKAAREARLPDSFKSAWEFRHPTIKLLKERKDDPDTFESEMQQIPKQRKNRKFKDSDFHFYTQSQIAGMEMVRYSIIDPSANDASDYKALITLGVPVASVMMEIYVLHAWIQQASVDDLLEETERNYKKMREKVIGVEMIAFAILMNREYQRHMKKIGYALPIQEITSVTNKEARIESLVPLVRNVLKFDPEEGDQSLLIRQLKGFPSSTPVAKGGIGDDGPDALEQGIKLISDFPAGLADSYRSVSHRAAIFKKGAY